MHPFPELTASHITKTALQMLALRKIEAWRQNNVPVRGRRNTTKKGVVDILGFHLKGARFVVCEVKTVNDRLSDEQKEFLQDVHDAGGEALVATQVGYHVMIFNYVEYLRRP